MALLLLVPAASFGVLMVLYLAPGSLGKIAFSFSKAWLFFFPVIWYFWVDRSASKRRADFKAIVGSLWQSPARFSARQNNGQPAQYAAESLALTPGSLTFKQFLRSKLPQPRELQVGLWLGMLMFGAILAIYGWLGHWIDVAVLRAKAQQVGIDRPALFLAGACYWTLINSLVEEYVWRWFVYRKCEALIAGAGAIFLCALCFTLHHSLILVAYTNWRVVILGSAAVFLAGAVWSWTYLTYRSIWSGYISHAFADLALAIVAWHLIFGMP